MATKEEIIAGTLRVIAMFNFKVTLRQVFYRLVEDLRILQKTNNEYKRLSKVLVDARLAGLVPMDVFADLNRGLAYDPTEFFEPDDHFERWFDAFKRCDTLYKVPRWHEQENYVEVWVEKAAMQGFFQQVTERLEVPLFPTRGYPSLTSLSEAAERLRGVEGQNIVILYFGDFDPSGVDITRYVRERMQDDFHIKVEVERIAINGEQLEEYSLPTAPPKQSDSRTAAFEAEHGDETVELEGFQPNDLTVLIREAVEGRFDTDKFDETREREREGRREIRERIDESLAEE
jgi:hypothetical protein